MTMQVDQLKEASEADAESFSRLVPQLSSSTSRISAGALNRVIEDPASTVFVARVDDVIVGTLTLVLYCIPTGLRAHIEDVVVDESERGHGIGKALNRAALDHAHRHGARSVDLSSRPSRVAANAMYQQMGFVQRETNVYRYTFG